MPDRETSSGSLMGLAEAASYLQLPADAVRALVDARFLAPAAEGAEGQQFALGDLKAFQARNADGGAGSLFVPQDAAGPQELLEAVDARSEVMGNQAFEIFADVFPEARGWASEERARFIGQATSRLKAILAVAAHGAEVDEALVGDLQGVGAAAAWDGSPLPQLLVVLRISRDLVVQTAVELAEERGRHWGLALSLLLTRVLPAMDRLTDALAQGYWAAVIGRQKEARARYQHVVEHASDGVFEADPGGRIQYANPQFGVIVGRRRLDDLQGSRVDEVLVLSDPSDGQDVLARAGREPQHLVVPMTRPDGVRRVLDVRTVPRLAGGELVGFQGIVRDVTAAHDLEAEKDRFLTSLLEDLDGPLAKIAELGGQLRSAGSQVGAEWLAGVGTSIGDQVERVAALADDLSHLSRLGVTEPVLTSRPVVLTEIVRAAMAEVGGADQAEVMVPPGLTVMADAKGLEQALSHLVDNAFRHGRPPVRVEVEGVEAGALQLAVTDHGDGVHPELVPVLFGRSHLMSDRGPHAGPRRGQGLALVRTLVEAMGGRVWHDPAPHGGACFRLTVPVPNRRRGDETIRL